MISMRLFKRTRALEKFRTLDPNTRFSPPPTCPITTHSGHARSSDNLRLSLPRRARFAFYLFPGAVAIGYNYPLWPGRLLLS
jgi:hypothetical protein